MQMSTLPDKVSCLPAQPGCYLMKGEDGEVLYIGKAKNLKQRVRSYFTGSHTEKIERLLREIIDFEYIVTDSEWEALILECNLIKKHRPRYNVMLKDDKSYPYIRLTREKHPRLEVTRHPKKDGSTYFGPYPHVGAAQQVKKWLDRLFPLRKCQTLPKRVCLYYHLQQCLAPCAYPVSSAQYEEMLQQITRFFQGGDAALQGQLKQEMEEAAAQLQFERAQELRDLLQDMEAVMQPQKMVLHDHVDRDVIGYAADKGWMCVQVFHIRQGKLMERNFSIFAHYHEPEEDLLSYITQFYHGLPTLPQAIALPPGIDQAILQPLFQGVRVHVPQRGVKKSLVEMAMENARIALNERFHLMDKDEKRSMQAVQTLSEVLEIGPIHRIEAFDNSHLQGTDPVSAMVVFIDGKPAKKEYRKFKIRTVDKPDDVGTMREVIRRRYTHLLKERLPLPDLLLVDGGKGQMAAASDVLENELGLYFPVGGMVKDDQHQTARLLMGDPPVEVQLAGTSPAFYLIQRIQEEVHRFALAFHRQTRSKTMLHSQLDAIPGVGPKRKQQLFRHFGSIAKMSEASIVEYRQAGIGESLAKTILAALQKG
jgi:excinuclease ABC subunit C